MKHPTNNEIWYAEQRDLAIEERDAAIARAEAAEAEVKQLLARRARDISWSWIIDTQRENLDYLDSEVISLRARGAELDKLTKMACSDGNWNYDSYLHGMANAFLIALATMKNEDYIGLPAPQRWLSRYEQATDMRARVAELKQRKASMSGSVNPVVIKSTARHIPDWSLVRLNDGRLGSFTKHVTGRNRALVHVSDKLGVEVKLSDDLEVLLFPAQTAGLLRDILAGEGE